MYEEIEMQMVHTITCRIWEMDDLSDRIENRCKIRVRNFKKECYAMGWCD